MFDLIVPGVYEPGDSLLHRLQARTKLLLVVWIVGSLFVAAQNEGHFTPYLAALLLVSAGIGLSRMGLSHLWRRTRLMIFLSLITAIPTLLFTEGEMVATLGPLVITAEGIWITVGVLSIFLLVFTLALLLTATTTPVALVEGLTLLLKPLRLLRLPVDAFALMALLALRFIPTLLEEAELLVKAQTARGASFTTGTLYERTQSLVTLVVPLFQGSLRRAAELASALDSRGYSLDGRQTPLHETTFRLQDYVVLALVVLVMTAALLV